MATITRAQLKRRERWKLMCAWNRNYTVIHSNDSWLEAFKMLFFVTLSALLWMHLKGILKIALMRSMEHVALLFLFKSVISVNQSRNGFRRSLSESRRVFKKASIFERQRGYFTWSWLVDRPMLSNNTPISCVIVSKVDPKRYYEFISQDKTEIARGERQERGIVKIVFKIISHAFISVFSLSKELINFS